MVHAQRRVPLSLRDDIKNELAKMEAQGVIAKIKEGAPTNDMGQQIGVSQENRWFAENMPRSKGLEQSHSQRASHNTYS